ncbi:uncharacterized protein CTHT_0022640 [Thermochaetoides thermophila DSM 1495]|uniref:Uncharacterized protein n=1 Tax=Chaetomium thermophilum (strain DSM 1495 / CBS 144.50 / IMI 039719) TaxID=759272 RepID=G0S4F6_CHATD|nr:hypothetical protein CTHT_0022640 [Thermochaetoides thermophila DSM 1495]EGS20434.1 hypothetical protein CTHT_0022640 [Thermochaetoides thermophila DSM 1495]
MSYYFAIIGTQDNPLFEYEFGTSKQGGDGQARFGEQARHLNQFILHSSLDIVEELQWTTGQLPQTEEAIKNFFNEVYENYVKAIMSPFYKANQEIKSPIFRQKVAAAGRKYL